jgi:peptidoglycan/LPS O-acetylase OafA/YrhL
MTTTSTRDSETAPYSPTDGPAAAGSQRFPALDGLRMIGALAVVTTHVGFSSGASLNTPVAGLLARLDAGVPLFFVISGFLLYRPHALARLEGTTRPSPGRYFKHRALRILPALWVAVVLAAVVLPHRAEVTTGHFLGVATLTQIYTPGPSIAGLTQMWSLATEAAFYVLLPVLAWGLARVPGGGSRWSSRTVLGLLGLVAGSAMWVAWVVQTGGGVRGLWLPAHLGWFGIGMALATWNVARTHGTLRSGPLDQLGAAPGTAWAAAGALYLLLATPIAGPFGLSESTVLQAVVKNVGYGVLGALLVLPAVAPEPQGSRLVRVLGGRLGRALGDISYGVFCYHLIVLGVVERVVGHRTFTGNFAQLWVGTVVLVLPVAWLSYRCLERPIIRRGRRSERVPVRG